MNCQKHKDREASGQCVNCYAYHCSECIVQKKVRTSFIETCPVCQDLIRPLKAVTTELPVHRMFGHALNFPLAPKDRHKLIGYGIFLMFMAFMYTIMPLNPIFYANWIIKTALWAIFVSYIVRAAKTTGMGSLDVPDWPDFVMWWESLLVPSIRVSLTWVVLVSLPILLGIALIFVQIGWGFGDFFKKTSPQTTEKAAYEIAAEQTIEIQKEIDRMYRGDMSPEELEKLERSLRNLQKNDFDGQPVMADDPDHTNEHIVKQGGPVAKLALGIKDFLQTAQGKKRFLMILLTILVFGILAFIGSLLYPMSFYIAAGFESLKSAVNPRTLIDLILKVPRDYAILIALLMVISFFQGGVTFIFGILGLLDIALIGKFIDLCIKLYFGLVFAFMVGRFAYVNRYILGFESEPKMPEIKETQLQNQASNVGKDRPVYLSPDREPNSAFNPANRLDLENQRLQTSQDMAKFAESNDPVEQDIARGREFKKLGELNSALECLNLALTVNPTHPIALRECFKIYIAMDDKEKAAATINKLMSFYASQDKRDEALVLYGEVSDIIPMHTFGQIAQRKIANWLKEVGDYKNAAIAYRNYAYKYTKDPFAATSLMEAGTLCKFELGNPSLAEKIFQIIIKNYPKAPEVQRARTLLSEIQNTPKQ